MLYINKLKIIEKLDLVYKSEKNLKIIVIII